MAKKLGSSYWRLWTATAISNLGDGISGVAYPWVASAVTGEVTIRLRRGDDFSIINTTGPALSYHPEKLSMERTENAAFGPVDRIGQLTMRNLDIADTRAKLEMYRDQGQLGSGEFKLIQEIGEGEKK